MKLIQENGKIRAGGTNNGRVNNSGGKRQAELVEDILALEWQI